MASLKVRTTFVKSLEASALDSVGLMPSTLWLMRRRRRAELREVRTLPERADYICLSRATSMRVTYSDIDGTVAVEPTGFLRRSLGAHERPSCRRRSRNLAARVVNSSECPPRSPLRDSMYAGVRSVPVPLRQVMFLSNVSVNDDVLADDVGVGRWPGSEVMATDVDLPAARRASRSTSFELAPFPYRVHPADLDGVLGAVGETRDRERPALVRDGRVADGGPASVGAGGFDAVARTS